VASSAGFVGNSEATLEHSAASQDIFYNSAAELGAPPVNVGVSVLEKDRVGVCLGDCVQVTRYDYMFDGSDLSAVAMPHEARAGSEVPPTFSFISHSTLPWPIWRLPLYFEVVYAPMPFFLSIMSTSFESDLRLYFPPTSDLKS
jgi:hypothetical protein